MFKRLLGNLPFNPSLIGQVSFYAKRLRKEASIRRLGLAFIVLAMLVQVFAVISPPQSSMAQSDNDLINGGFGSQGEAVNVCQNNVGNFKDIAGYFNISCDNIAGAHTVTLHSNDYGGQLYSMGRIAYGKAGETPVSINGTNYYLRFLSSWDSLGYPSTYRALQGTGSDGRTFFILYDCGNLVFIGLPPAPPAPAPQPVCTVSGVKWYEGWGFWYTSPDGSVNNPAIGISKTNPCLTTTPPPTQKCPLDSTILITDVRCKTCPYNQNILNTNAACKPCEASQTREDKTACLEYFKKATNNTQGIANANNTTAKAGDAITYTLSVKNGGKVDISKFVIQENLSDILDYADIVSLNGGAKDSHNIVAWPAITIKAGQTVTKQFSIKVKNPIPQTPVSASDPGHFDLTMTNVYGNSVSIKVPGSPAKTAETVVRTLPNTGPGSSLIVGFGLTTVVAYFFARSRLMAKELDLVRNEYNTSGGI